MNSYSGHVSPGQWALRTSGAYRIVKVSVGPMDNNCYLLYGVDDGVGILIDAANDAATISGVLAAAPDFRRLAGIVTTHQHADHWQALAEIVAGTAATTYAGAADTGGIPVPTDVPLQHGDTISAGQLRLQVIGLRGHTPGSVAIVLSAADTTHIFTGDSLFPGGVGKTTSPADFDSLIDDVSQRIFAVYPDETWIYPGHGDDTTVGAQRPQLNAWRQRGW